MIYGKACNNYKLIIKKFKDPLLCIIFNSTDLTRLTIYWYISGITNLMACSRRFISAINEHRDQRGTQNCKESILYLQAPHRSPSILTARTASSINFISVSSSHGFTSRIILDLAIRAGSEI
jgi:hypothetical protein